MTENEYTMDELIDFMYNVMDDSDEEAIPFVKEVIQALEEIQQYRAIGTVEEFKALKEKKNILPIATIKISKEDMQKIVDEKVAQIELDIQEIRAKAIDEFAERLKNFIAKNVEDAESSNDLCCEIFQSEIDEIAEQMKAGE